MKLPHDVVALISLMYQAGCNQYVGKNIFDAPPLENVMSMLKDYLPAMTTVSATPPSV